MATSIVMPQLGYDMREGTVVRWVKQEGDEVVANEVIAEIETDKAVVEFKPTTGGVLRRIVASEGEAVPVGNLIAVIGDADEAPARRSGRVLRCGCRSRPTRARGGYGSRSGHPCGRTVGGSPGLSHRPPPGPGAGVDLSIITGSGPGGAYCRSRRAGRR